MSKRTIYLISFVALLCLVGNMQAASIYWDDGNSVDHLWSSSDNWDGNSLPGSSDYAIVQSGDAANDPTLNSDVADVNRVYVGYAGTGAAHLTVETGTDLTVSGLLLRLGHYSSTASSVHGYLDMSGGSISVTGSGSYIDVGQKNTDGTLNITGGSITAPKFRVPASINGTGTINLDGGTINIGSGGLELNNTGTETGTMDVENGTMIIDGNVTSTIQGYIDSGYITAYGGSGTLNLDYNVTNAGKTTLTAATLTVYWDDGDVSDHLWSSADNWLGDSVPGSSQSAIIKAGYAASDPNLSSSVANVNKLYYSVPPKSLDTVFSV